MVLIYSVLIINYWFKIIDIQNKNKYFNPQIRFIMKKISLIISMITLCVGFSSTALAQVSATETASATIVSPIAIVNAGPMNFGDIAVQGIAAGTVVMTPAGVRTPSAGLTLPATGLETVALFTVTGADGYNYAITLPGTIALAGTTPGSTVSDFTSDSTGVLTGGIETVSVGGTLNIVASQVAGAYTNTTDLDVTVNYN